jgi:two-component system, LytTR family, sensor histidine kinase AlgZ
MHPILGNGRRLLIYLLAWVFVGALLSVALRNGGPWLAITAFFMPLSLLFGFVALSAGYICRAFPLDVRARVSNVIIAHLVAGAVAGGIWVALGGAWARGVDWFTTSVAATALADAQSLLLFVVGALLFWLAAVFHYLLLAFEASREAETRALELSLAAREAELKALRAQIDPHFMFNSLHSISALTTSEPIAARRMCLLLADFLRDTLRLGANARIPLAEELRLADQFLAIEQIRLGSRLRVAHEFDAGVAHCLVPPLILQPLVENAVLHGISQLVDGGTISLAAHCAGPMLTITVTNPCDPERPRSRGVGLGLELLRKRLTAQCGVTECVRAIEEAGRFCTTIHIPAAT